MSRKRNIHLFLAVALSIQLMVSFFVCSTSFAALSPDVLSSRIATAMDTTEGIWWYSTSPEDQGKVISLLRSETRDLKDRTFNPISSDKSFTVEGYHFLVDSDYSNGISFSKNKLINTSAVIQAVYPDRAPETVTTSEVVGAITTFPYNDESITSKFYGPIVRTLEMGDQSGFSFRVNTSKLGVGKYQVVVRAEDQNNTGTYIKSAVIPFFVERDSVYKLTKTHNDKIDEYDDEPDVDLNKNTPTWSVYKRDIEDAITVSGYFLSGRLDESKNPISIKEVRLAMNFTSGDSATAKVSDGSTDGSFVELTTPGLIPTSSVSQYTYKYSNITQADKRYNVGFNATLKLTTAQLNQFNKKLLTGGKNRIAIAFYAYDPSQPDGRLIYTLYQDINVDIPPVKTELLQPNGKFTFNDIPLANTDTEKFFLNEVDITTQVYDLRVTGYYDLPKTSDGKVIQNITRIETFVPGNGELFPKTIWSPTDASPRDTHIDFANKIVKLNITELKKGMHSTTSTEVVPIRIIVTADTGKQYTMSKDLYFIKAQLPPPREEMTDTVVVAYEPKKPRVPSDPAAIQEWYADVAQTIREIDCTNTNTLINQLQKGTAVTDGTYYRVEGLVLAGKSVGKKPGDMAIQNIQIASSFDKTPIKINGADLVPVDKNSTNVSDATYYDAKYVNEYYAAFDKDTSNKVYKFSANIPIDFSKLKSGSQKLYILVTLKNPAGKISSKGSTRPIYISKLGESMGKNTVRVISSPIKNATIQIPAVTRYNAGNLVTIPVNGVLLDGNYSGFKSVSLYFDKTFMKKITTFAPSGNDRIEQMSNDYLSMYYPSYTNTFDIDGNPSSTSSGVYTKDRLNVKYYGSIQIKNNSKALSTSNHSISVRAETYDGRIFEVIQPVKILKFKTLHTPEIMANMLYPTPLSSSAILSVRDADLDVKTATYTWTYETPSGTTELLKGTVSAAPGLGTIDVPLTIPYSNVQKSVYLNVNATDWTGRSTSFRKNYTYGTVAAYGLRKLTPDYNGPCIRVVGRTTKSTQKDIYFASDGTLDTKALLDYASSNGNDVYVTQWYDQSGNGNHIYASTIRKPCIVKEGIICSLPDKTSPTKPAIYFDGDADYLRRSNFVNGSVINEPCTIYSVFNTLEFTAFDQVVFSGSAGNDSNSNSFSLSFPAQSTLIPAKVKPSIRAGNFSTLHPYYFTCDFKQDVYPNTTYLYTGIYDKAGYKTYVNGLSGDPNPDPQKRDFIMTGLTISDYYAADTMRVHAWNGYFSELILITTSSFDSGIVNNQKAFYNIN